MLQEEFMITSHHLCAKNFLDLSIYRERCNKLLLNLTRKTRCLLKMSHLYFTLKCIVYIFFELDISI